MATLLFLGASISQVPAIRYAREAGHRIVAVDGDPNALGFGLVDEAVSVDFSDVERVVAVGRRVGADGVLAVCSDRAVLPAAAAAEALALPGIGVDVAHAMTDKPTMRARLALAGVPQPDYVAVDGSHAGQAVTSVAFPCVLKPADSGGQRGVYLVENAQQLERHLAAALAFSRSERVIVEEYIEGSELNGMLVVRDGQPTLVSLSDRLRPRGPGFGVGWIHSYPASLPGSALACARDVAFAAVAALGLRDGIAFPQLIVDGDGKAWLIEVAARIAAGQMADLVWFATGVNLFEVAVAQALGQPVPDALLRPRATRPVAIRFFTASPGLLPVGTVSAIEGLDAVRESPGVLAAGLYFDVGDTIGPLQVDADRRGYVVATAQTSTAALELADQAAAKLVVRTQETDASFEHDLLHTRGRLLPIAIVCVLLAATGLALLLSENAKLQHALIAGTRVDKQFSPICHCPQDVAHISFRLLRKTVVSVQLIDAANHTVTSFVRDRLLSRGLKRFIWNGRSALGRVFADGSYRPEVTFAQLHRTLRLPSPILLDTKPPRILNFSVRTAGRRLYVRYRFGEPAHALLLLDGRRAVFTRRAIANGVLEWSGTFRDGRRARSGRSTPALVAIDLAGNRSRPRYSRPIIVS